jgi:hypothetical protein
MYHAWIFFFFFVSWSHSCVYDPSRVWWKTKIDKSRKALSIVVYDSTSLSKYISKYKIRKLKLEKYVDYLEIHKQEKAGDILHHLNSTYPIGKDCPLIWLFRDKEYIGSYEKIPYYIRDVSILYKNIHYISKEEECIRYITSQNKYVCIHNNAYDTRYIRKAIRPYFYLYTFFNLDEIEDIHIRNRLYDYLIKKYKLLYHGEVIWHFSNGYYMGDIHYRNIHYRNRDTIDPYQMQ